MDLLFASALGLSLLLFSSPAALEDKESTIPSTSDLSRVGGRQAPSEAIHLLERGTKEAARWEGSSKDSWEAVSTKRPLYGSGNTWLLQTSTFVCTAVMMWGLHIAGAYKNKQQLLWIFIALFWEPYLSSSSKRSHLNTVAGCDAHEIRSVWWTGSL